MTLGGKGQQKHDPVGAQFPGRANPPVGLYAHAGMEDPELLRALLRIAPTELLGAVLLLGAAFLSGDWCIKEAALAGSTRRGPRSPYA